MSKFVTRLAYAALLAGIAVPAYAADAFEPAPYEPGPVVVEQGQPLGGELVGHAGQLVGLPPAPKPQLVHHLVLPLMQQVQDEPAAGGHEVVGEVPPVDVQAQPGHVRADGCPDGAVEDHPVGPSAVRRGEGAEGGGQGTQQFVGRGCMHGRKIGRLGGSAGGWSGVGAGRRIVSGVSGIQDMGPEVTGGPVVWSVGGGDRPKWQECRPILARRRNSAWAANLANVLNFGHLGVTLQGLELIGGRVVRRVE